MIRSGGTPNGNFAESKMMGYSRDSFYASGDRQCATSHLQKGGPFTPWLAGLCDEYDGRLKNGGGHGPERTRRIPTDTDPR